MTLRFLLFFLFAGLSALAENITILGINDIHAAVEQMPKLYTAVQQERAAAPTSSSHEVMAKGLRLLKEVDYSTARRANVTREDAGE